MQEELFVLGWSHSTALLCNNSCVLLRCVVCFSQEL
jgi:hypothetical protein